MGQNLGETGRNDLEIEDPLTHIFMFAKHMNMNPEDVLNMDAEIFTLYSAFVGGYNTGENWKYEQQK